MKHHSVPCGGAWGVTLGKALPRGMKWVEQDAEHGTVGSAYALGAYLEEGAFL